MARDRLWRLDDRHRHGWDDVGQRYPAAGDCGRPSDRRHHDDQHADPSRRTEPGEDTLKVVQERLRVGKREVAQGAVRIRSYVVERPVEEQVKLHSEHVTVERRPVDRAADPTEAGLFQERTLEARATAEEAVVQKEARVVEEIGIHKVAEDRSETIRDTVRETKVEVDDQTAQGTGIPSAQRTGTGAGQPRE